MKSFAVSGPWIKPVECRLVKVTTVGSGGSHVSAPIEPVFKASELTVTVRIAPGGAGGSCASA